VSAVFTGISPDAFRENKKRASEAINKKIRN
jgi:hypothetical protein